MSIVEESKRREWIDPVKSLAQKLYDKQVKDITNISHLDWYKQIKDYWTRVKEWTTEQLKTVDIENLKITQMKYEIASEFVTFLSNLESTKETRAKVKES